jgi:hypothetical protein
MIRLSLLLSAAIGLLTLGLLKRQRYCDYGNDPHCADLYRRVR